MNRALVPEDISTDRNRRTAIISLARACNAFGRSVVDSTTLASDVLRRSWPSDVTAKAIINRGAVPPTSTTSVGPLAHQIVAEVLTALGPASAGAAILDAGLSLSFDGAAAISVPTIVADANLAGFVGESMPIPVVQGTVEAPVLLHPRKLGAILTLTREMVNSSNAEVLFTDLLVQSTALALDRVLLGSGADDGTNPAGLRNGIAALTASNNADVVEAEMQDIENLLNVVAQISAVPPILVAAPARAITMQLRAPHDLSPLTVLASNALAPDEVVAVAPVAVASATDDMPTIDVSTTATLHMEDDPQPIVSDTGQVAVPLGSLFQADRIGIRVRYPVDWALRDPCGVAWLKATGW